MEEEEKRSMRRLKFFVRLRGGLYAVFMVDAKMKLYTKRIELVEECRLHARYLLCAATHVGREEIVTASSEGLLKRRRLGSTREFVGSGLGDRHSEMVQTIEMKKSWSFPGSAERLPKSR